MDYPGNDNPLQGPAYKLAVDLSRGPDLGQRGPADPKEITEDGVPLQGRHVHQHGPGGVGHIRHKHAPIGASCQIPDEPGVHGAKAQGAVCERGDDFWVVLVQEPPVFEGGEVGGEGEPAEWGEGLVRLVWEGLREAGDEVSRAAIVPD